MSETRQRQIDVSDAAWNRLKASAILRNMKVGEFAEALLTGDKTAIQALEDVGSVKLGRTIPDKVNSGG